MRKVLDKNKTCFRIREVCTKHNVSINQLAEYMDVSPQTVYSWFGAKKLPSIDHLVELSDLLDVHIGDLIVTREVSLWGAEDSVQRYIPEARQIAG